MRGMTVESKSFTDLEAAAAACGHKYPVSGMAVEPGLGQRSKGEGGERTEGAMGQEGEKVRGQKRGNQEHTLRCRP